MPNTVLSTVIVNNVLFGKHMHFSSMKAQRKAGMELTFHHQADNNISHQSLETMYSVQNVTDD